MQSMPTILDRPHLLARCLIVVAITVTSFTPVCGDIVPNPLTGGKDSANKRDAKTNVAIVEEVLKLHCSKDSCQVDVVFTMKNTGNEPESMQVGFPCRSREESESFKVALDGEAVKSGTKSNWDGESRQPNPLLFWKTWETTFAPGTPVKIAVSYSAKLRNKLFSVGEHNIFGSLSEHLPKNDIPERPFPPLPPEPPERAELRRQLLARDMNYFPQAGKHWSGPIGYCRIEFTFDDLTTDNLTLDSLKFERDAATITRDKIVWELKEYKPQQIVHLEVTPNITRAGTLKLLETFQKKHPHNPVIPSMLYDYLVDAKRHKDADAVMLTLLTPWQDKIAIWGPERQSGSLHDDSRFIFFMVLNRVTWPRNSSHGFQNRQVVAPVIERIALRVKDQIKLIPPNSSDDPQSFGHNIDVILEWCKANAKPE